VAEHAASPTVPRTKREPREPDTSRGTPPFSVCSRPLWALRVRPPSMGPIRDGPRQPMNRPLRAVLGVASERGPTEARASTCVSLRHRPSNATDARTCTARSPIASMPAGKSPLGPVPAERDCPSQSDEAFRFGVPDQNLKVRKARNLNQRSAQKHCQEWPAAIAVVASHRRQLRRRGRTLGHGCIRLTLPPALSMPMACHNRASSSGHWRSVEAAHETHLVPLTRTCARTS
jgi:hypothetical protein